MSSSEDRSKPLIVALAAYAVCMLALAVAGVAAWMRCGRGEDCATDLAWAVVAVGPAALIGIVMLFLLRAKTASPLARSMLLAGGVAVATAPLAAFLVADARFIPAFVVLLGGAIWIAIRAETDEGRVGDEETAERSHASRAEVHPERSDTHGRRVAQDGRRLQALAIMLELSELNRDILRFCDDLSKAGFAQTR